MSRRSRRKTLSHLEVENFLSDLQDIGVDSFNKFQPKDSIIKLDKENHTVSSHDISPNLTNLNPEQPNNDFQQLDEINDLEDPSEVLQIREFCQLFYKQGLVTKFDYSTHISDEMRRIACSVSSSTDYNLLPPSIITREYNSNPSSIESKRSLLLSLSPMLMDAERCKKIETEACETFTRCKSRSTKGADRVSCYEYCDVDTGILVDPAEYERRYYLWLSLKANIQNPLLPSSPPQCTSIGAYSSRSTTTSLSKASTSNLVVNNESGLNTSSDSSSSVHRIQNSKEPSSSSSSSLIHGHPSRLLPSPRSNSPDSIPSDDITLGKSGKGVRRHDRSTSRGSSSSRRVTLSPATARSMMLDCVEVPVEEEGTNNEGSSGSEEEHRSSDSSRILCEGSVCGPEQETGVESERVLASIYIRSDSNTILVDFSGQTVVQDRVGAAKGDETAVIENYAGEAVVAEEIRTVEAVAPAVGTGVSSLLEPITTMEESQPLYSTVSSYSEGATPAVTETCSTGVSVSVEGASIAYPVELSASELTSGDGDVDTDVELTPPPAIDILQGYRHERNGSSESILADADVQPDSPGSHADTVEMSRQSELSLSAATADGRGDHGDGEGIPREVAVGTEIKFESVSVIAPIHDETPAAFFALPVYAIIEERMVGEPHVDDDESKAMSDSILGLYRSGLHSGVAPCESGGYVDDQDDEYGDIDEESRKNNYHSDKCEIQHASVVTGSGDDLTLCRGPTEDTLAALSMRPALQNTTKTIRSAVKESEARMYAAAAGLLIRPPFLASRPPVKERAIPDILLVQQRAELRMRQRQEQVKWKYLWEIVSFEAAHAGGRYCEYRDAIYSNNTLSADDNP